FVYRRHLYAWRKVLKLGVNFARVFDVAVAMAVDEDCLGAQLIGGAQRHGRMHSEFSGGVGCSGDDSTLVGAAPDDHRLALERRIEQLFDRDEEGVHVEMEERSHGRHSFLASATRGRPARQLVISASRQPASISRTASTTAWPSSMISQPPGVSRRRASGIR